MHLKNLPLLQYEVKIYEAQQSMGIGRCSRTEVRDGLICAIQYSGCQPPEKEVFAFCLDFIIKNFYMFKLHEFVTAFELYALGKLNVDKAIVFNPKLIGDVMNAYKPLSLQVRDKTAPKMPELKNDIQVDEEQAIKDEKEYWEKSKNKDWRMLNYMVFDYLWKRKKIELSQEKREAIKSKVKAHYQTRIKTEADKEAVQDEVFIRLACKRYTLALYFNEQL